MPKKQREGCARLHFQLLEVGYKDLRCVQRGLLRGELGGTRDSRLVARLNGIENLLRRIPVGSSDCQTLAQRQYLEILAGHTAQESQRHRVALCSRGAGLKSCSVSSRAILAPEVNLIAG